MSENNYMKIKLNTINDISSFTTACGNYYEGEIDIKQGRQIIDGKSILGTIWDYKNKFDK